MFTWSTQETEYSRLVCPVLMQTKVLAELLSKHNNTITAHCYCWTKHIQARMHIYYINNIQAPCQILSLYPFHEVKQKLFIKEAYFRSWKLYFIPGKKNYRKTLLYGDSVCDTVLHFIVCSGASLTVFFSKVTHAQLWQYIWQTHRRFPVWTPSNIVKDLWPRTWQNLQHHVYFAVTLWLKTYYFSELI